MSFGRIFDIFGAIVSVAMAFVIVSSKYVAGDITAWGTTFSSSLKAATGH